MLTETGGHGKKTVTIPLGSTRTLTIAQATDVQLSQPRPLRCIQQTLDEPLGLKSKNRPRGLGEGSPNNGGLPSIVLTISVPEVPFRRGTASDLTSMIGLHLDPREAALPKGICHW